MLHSTQGREVIPWAKSLKGCFTTDVILSRYSNRSLSFLHGADSNVNFNLVENKFRSKYNSSVLLSKIGYYYIRLFILLWKQHCSGHVISLVRDTLQTFPLSNCSNSYLEMLLSHFHTFWTPEPPKKEAAERTTSTPMIIPQAAARWANEVSIFSK